MARFPVGRLQRCPQWCAVIAINVVISLVIVNFFNVGGIAETVLTTVAERSAAGLKDSSIVECEPSPSPIVDYNSTRITSCEGFPQVEREWTPLQEPVNHEPRWTDPPSSTRTQQLITETRAKQDEYCRVAQHCRRDLTNKGSYKWVEHIKLLSADHDDLQVDMLVIPVGDTVSNYVMGDGYWEPGESEVVLRWLRAWGDGSPVNPKTGGPITLLDIGANVGWFSILIGAAGFRVIGFEAMQRNSEMIRNSLCMNPYVRRRVTLFNHALGNETKTDCVVTSHINNRGDGTVVCGLKEDQLWPGHQIRERLPDLVRLDDYIADQIESIAVVKIDVEGFEDLVMLGAQKTILSVGVPHILIEFTPDFLRLQGSDPLAHLQRMESAGYVIATEPNGPAADLVKLVTDGQQVNLYLTHRDLAQMRIQRTGISAPYQLGTG